MAADAPNEPQEVPQDDIDAALAAAADDLTGGAATDGSAAEGDAPAEAAAAPSSEAPADSQAAQPDPDGHGDQSGSSAGDAEGFSKAEMDAALSSAQESSSGSEGSADASATEPAAASPTAGVEGKPEAGSGDSLTGSPSAGAKTQAPPPSAGSTPLELPDFSGRAGVPREQGISLLNDVNLNVRIELGRANMLIEDVLKLGEGSVVELDKLAGDPVDVLVNERLVARGEVLVLNENFCVRISEILQPSEEGVSAG